MDISKYLEFLDDKGWSELIYSIWEPRVKKELFDNFPDIKPEEWERIKEVIFI